MTAQADAPLRVLAVCTANICRSPVMEHLLRDRLDPARFVVESAGVQGLRDQPVDPDALVGLTERGLDAAAFRSRRLDARTAGQADLVLTATREHRAGVLALAPQALRRTFTVRELAALAGLAQAGTVTELVAEAARLRSQGPADADVADPYRRGAEAHAAATAQIEQAVDAIAAALNALPSR